MHLHYWFKSSSVSCKQMDRRVSRMSHKNSQESRIEIVSSILAQRVYQLERYCVSGMRARTSFYPLIQFRILSPCQTVM